MKLEREIFHYIRKYKWHKKHMQQCFIQGQK